MKYKIGTKIKCKYTGGLAYLTLGKVYSIECTDNNEYRIVSDLENGNTYYFTDIYDDFYINDWFDVVPIICLGGE